MALKYYRNLKTNEVLRTMKGQPTPKEEWEEMIMAPSGKMMVCADEATGKSKHKDMEQMLKERARNHSRETSIDDLIAINKESGTDEAIIQMNCLDEKGERRKKISDI